MTHDEVISEHYRRLGPRYDTMLRYSPDFVQTLTDKMVDALRLQPDDRLVDLGCGTGMYTVELLRQVPLRHPVLCVDPSPEMLAHVPDEAVIRPRLADALEFSTWPGTYDKILMKETVHHVDDRGQLFANLHDRLSPDGVMLLVHVPPRVQYPLFEAALERCLRWMADPEDVVTDLEKAGFWVEWDGLDHQHAIPKEQYLDMVRNRYMSVLTSFTAGELEAGLREMAETHADDEVLHFVDHFDYLTATPRV